MSSTSRLNTSISTHGWSLAKSSRSLPALCPRRHVRESGIHPQNCPQAQTEQVSCTEVCILKMN